MFDRILYAAETADGRPRSFDLVRDIALANDSEVVVLRVGEVTEEQFALARKHEIDVETAAEEAEIRARIEGQLASGNVAEALRAAGVFARSIFCAGRIGEELLKAADDIDADLIVIGSAPRTVLTALLTGNVTDEVVRRARRPVLVIPQLDPNGEEDAIGESETAADKAAAGTTSGDGDPPPDDPQQ